MELYLLIIIILLSCIYAEIKTPHHGTVSIIFKRARGIAVGGAYIEAATGKTVFAQGTIFSTRESNPEMPEGEPASAATALCRAVSRKSWILLHML
jgi:hypothetical protein